MKSTVGVDEAKAHLLQLLERVAKGERITITKHGACRNATVSVPEAFNAGR